MYFWKVDKLVEDFRLNKVSQKEELKYMLLFTVVTTAITDPFLYMGSSYNIYDFTITLLGLFISVWGIYTCYKINSAGDDKDFIVRIMCIGLPVMIRIIVYFIPIMIVATFVEILFGAEDVLDESNIEIYETTLYEAVVFSIFLLAYFVFLAKKIRVVSSIKPSQSTSF